MSDFITSDECARRLGVSRSTFDAETRHAHGFPDPFRPSPRVVRWHWPTVERWAMACAA